MGPILYLRAWIREESHTRCGIGSKIPLSLRKAGNLEGKPVVAKRKESANWKRKVARELVYLGLEIEGAEAKLTLLKTQNPRLMPFLYLGFRFTKSSGSGNTQAEEFM